MAVGAAALVAPPDPAGAAEARAGEAPSAPEAQGASRDDGQARAGEAPSEARGDSQVAAPQDAGPARARRDERRPPEWTFLTNHAHVLICIARAPDARIRDIADEVGITERAVQLIITDLERAGYLTREREGRRNHYAVQRDRLLRHPIEQHRRVSSLLELGLGPRRGV